MPQSWREALIPPYTVTVEQDGCFRAYVDHPDAWGMIGDCASFISRHLPPPGMTFSIMEIDTGHCPSFAYTPAPVRIQLQVQDLSAPADSHP